MGAAGGRARAVKLTPAQRKQIAQGAARARWAQEREKTEESEMTKTTNAVKPVQKHPHVKLIEDYVATAEQNARDHEGNLSGRGPNGEARQTLALIWQAHAEAGRYLAKLIQHLEDLKS